VVARVHGPRSDRDPLRAHVPHAPLERNRRSGAQEDQLAFHDSRRPPGLPVSARHYAWAEVLAEEFRTAASQCLRGQDGHAASPQAVFFGAFVNLRRFSAIASRLSTTQQRSARTGAINVRPSDVNS
jgi:hypothetical protein